MAYSEVAGFLFCRMSIAVVRAVSMCIHSRFSETRPCSPDDGAWTMGAIMGQHALDLILVYVTVSLITCLEQWSNHDSWAVLRWIRDHTSTLIHISHSMPLTKLIENYSMLVRKLWLLLTQKSINAYIRALVFFVCKSKLSNLNHTIILIKT